MASPGCTCVARPSRYRPPGGPSRFLPDRSGILRFRDMNEAVDCLDAVMREPERQAREARSLAEEYFDARRVAASVVERAL